MLGCHRRAPRRYFDTGERPTNTWVVPGLGLESGCSRLNPFTKGIRMFCKSRPSALSGSDDSCCSRSRRWRNRSMSVFTIISPEKMISLLKKPRLKPWTLNSELWTVNSEQWTNKEPTSILESHTQGIGLGQTEQWRISGAFTVKSRGRREKANTPPFDNFFFEIFQKK